MSCPTLWLSIAVLESEGTHMERCIFLLLTSSYPNTYIEVISPPTLSVLNCVLLTPACLILSTFLASSLHSFAKVCWSKQIRWTITFFWLSHVSFSPKACELSVALLKGSCWETQEYIFCFVVQNTIALHSTQASVWSGLPKLSVGKREVLYSITQLVLYSRNHAAACRADL